MPQPLHHQEGNLSANLMRLGGLESWSAHFRKLSCPCSYQTMTPEPSSPQPIFVMLSWLMLNTKVGDFTDQHKVNT